MSLRLSAALLLDKVQQGGSLNTLYDEAQREVDDSQRAFFKELVYGSLRLWPLYKGHYATAPGEAAKAQRQRARSTPHCCALRTR
jgi:hypothetical protein